MPPPPPQAPVTAVPAGPSQQQMAAMQGVPVSLALALGGQGSGAPPSLAQGTGDEDEQFFASLAQGGGSEENSGWGEDDGSWGGEDSGWGEEQEGSGATEGGLARLSSMLPQPEDEGWGGEDGWGEEVEEQQQEGGASVGVMSPTTAILTGTRPGVGTELQGTELQGGLARLSSMLQSVPSEQVRCSAVQPNHSALWRPCPCSAVQRSRASAPTVSTVSARV